MRRRPLRDVPSSVHARLKSLAAHRKVSLNFLLRSYTAERFLYRLGASPLADRFTLKGATLFLVWGGDTFRGTRDLDFLASESEGGDSINRQLAEICAVACPEDGVVFESDPGQIRVRPIRVNIPHGGQRASLRAQLGRIRLPIQVDIGFGDVITPAPQQCRYPTLLDHPAPNVWTYPRETHVAEKFNALVEHGHAGSRVKDLWDIAALADRYSFDGATLRTAVERTFHRRGTTLTAVAPPALRSRYYSDAMRLRLWDAFRRKTVLVGSGPVTLADAGERIRMFLDPVRLAIARDEPFRHVWPPGGPWRVRRRKRNGA